MAYTISEAACKMRTTSYTLRYYEREGLLPFIDRSAGGIRMFKEEDIESIKLIGCLKSAGMSLKEIRQFVEQLDEGDSTIPQRREMFYERRRVVEEQIESLKKTLDVLNYKCWFYDVALEAGSTSVPKSMKLEELSAEVRELKRKADL